MTLIDYTTPYRPTLRERCILWLIDKLAALVGLVTDIPQRR
jgi:hypothetical protein